MQPASLSDSAPAHGQSSDAPNFFSTVRKVCGRPLVVFLGLLLAVLAAYMPSLDGQFLWDDQALVVENLLIRSPLFCLEAFRHTLFGGLSNFFRPTQTLVFIANYYFWGFETFGYHLTSVLIHGVNGFLLFLLLRRLLPVLRPEAFSRPDAAGGVGGAEIPAFVLAALWALHPVHNAAVAYISGSADSLAMMFCVSAWLLAEHWRAAAPGWRAGGLAAGGAASFLAGLCSKEIAFVWLALFVCYSLVFRTGKIGGRRADWLLIAGACAALILYSLLRHTIPMPVSQNPVTGHPAVLTALRALGDYGSLLIFPVRLLMERQVYPNPRAVLTPEDKMFYSSLTAGGVTLLAILVAGCWWRGPGRKLRVFGVCWFMCGFLPVSNLFVTINAAVAEHWLYLPSIGFLLFAAGCLPEIKTYARRVGAFTLVMTFVAALGIRTHLRSYDWVDEITFFNQTVQAGGDLPRARMGIANAYTHLKDDKAALQMLRQIAADTPGYLPNQINLGIASLRAGQMQEGQALLRRAFDRCDDQEPRTVLIVISNLDKLENSPDWPVKRQRALDLLRERFPDAWEIPKFDAQQAEQAGNPVAALPRVSAYAKTHWWHYPSHLALGRIFSAAGQPDAAKQAFLYASRLDVHDADALAQVAEVDFGQGRLVEAGQLQNRAIARQPASARQRLLLASILSALGRTAEAAEQAETARSLLQSTPEVSH